MKYFCFISSRVHNINKAVSGTQIHKPEQSVTARHKRQHMPNLTYSQPRQALHKHHT